MNFLLLIGLLTGPVATACVEPAVPTVPSGVASDQAYDALREDIRDYNAASYSYEICLTDEMGAPSTSDEDRSALVEVLAAHKARLKQYKNTARAKLRAYQP